MTTDAQPLTIAELNAAPAPELSALLRSCCGSTEWVRRMAARRPFGSMEDLLGVAEQIWWSLAPDDWLEAFAHHPRIGEQRAAADQDARARSWSASEQSGSDAAGADVRAALEEGNREYERRFGHIYLICATGKSADQMLALLRRRLANDPSAELRVAAGEQAKITRLRLLKLVGAPASEGS